MDDRCLVDGAISRGARRFLEQMQHRPRCNAAAPEIVHAKIRLPHRFNLTAGFSETRNEPHSVVQPTVVPLTESTDSLGLICQQRIFID